MITYFKKGLIQIWQMFDYMPKRNYIKLLFGKMFPRRKKGNPLFLRNVPGQFIYFYSGNLPALGLSSFQKFSSACSNIEYGTVSTIEFMDKPYLLPKVLKEFSAELILMGSFFRITLVADEEQGEALLTESVSKIKEIENWLSSWKPNSITTQLNNEAASTPVEVTEEYYQLVKRCMGISELTQGAFDVTFNGLGDLYTFDEKVHELPDHQTIKNHLQHVGFDKIDLQPDRKIWFKDTETKISFGAIGKGYAAEVVKQLMLLNGVHGGVINASGDLTTWGTRANGEPWKVGVPDPDDQSKVLLWLPFENKAIATSGDYEKYFIHEGKRYSHIINPKTGLPVVGSRSVSIISDSAELSDALATAVSVMGLEIGMNLINQLDGVECVFIDSNRNLHFSNGLKKHTY